jgi:hypothetical protein
MFPQRAQAFWETAARDASDASRPAVPFSMPRHEEPFPSILHFLQILQSSFLLLLSGFCFSAVWLLGLLRR